MFEETFPRSAKYDTEFIMSGDMGPNPMWLTEILTQSMTLYPGMKVLDLGCGKAISSIFMAEEFGVQVWSADSWIPPTEILTNIADFGLENLAFPIYAEANKLPFAHHFFDAIISIDAFHYFGTDEFYLPYLLQFLKPQGEIGIIGPGLQKPLPGRVPSNLSPYWTPAFHAFKTREWWEHHWAKTGLVKITNRENVKNGWHYWYEWEKLLVDNQSINPDRTDDLELLKADQGEYMGFVKMVAEKL